MSSSTAKGDAYETPIASSDAVRVPCPASSSVNQKQDGFDGLELTPLPEFSECLSQFSISVSTAVQQESSPQGNVNYEN